MSQYSFLLLCLQLVVSPSTALLLTVKNPTCIPGSRHRVVAKWPCLNAENKDNDWDDNNKLSLKLDLKEKISWDDDNKIPLPQEPSNTPRKEERDLVIPIFALVSLAGLFGTYAYEMWRLASKGELYLPWT